jgi:hypothetical protein
MAELLYFALASAKMGDFYRKFAEAKVLLKLSAMHHNAEIVPSDCDLREQLRSDRYDKRCH